MPCSNVVLKAIARNGSASKSMSQSAGVDLRIFFHWLINPGAIIRPAFTIRVDPDLGGSKIELVGDAVVCVPNELAFDIKI